MIQSYIFIILEILKISNFFDKNIGWVGVVIFIMFLIRCPFHIHNVCIRGACIRIFSI